jgi:AraC-like DNA-binding protein
VKRSADYVSTPRPVVALQDEYPAGFVDPMHSHQRTQLLYASAGVMSVVTSETSFVLPPQRAVWLPAGTMHEVSCRGPVSLRTLYIDSPRNGPTHCRIIEVSELVKALILEVVGFAAEYDVNGREGRIVALLLDEIGQMPNAPYQARMPRDARLAKVCRAILADPADPRDLDDWARMAGMGRRTFTRSFKQQTGMGLAVWRQQVRLMEALSRLASGQSITAVALDVGYESPSAFTAMFHRNFGVPPSQYQLR